MTEIAALVVQTREGNTDAFTEIVRRFQDMALGYGYSLLGDLQLAEDGPGSLFGCLPLLVPVARAGRISWLVSPDCIQTV